ncbi:MAG TPA: hypothetical protein VJU53_08795 [Burkholderiaceae bacterium]|nr:hypothetical protein [Burkholderiaceae bacterium]
MTSRTSRFPIVAKRQPEHHSLTSAHLIIGSLLFATAMSLQSPVRATPLDVGTPAEAAEALAATKGHDSAAKIAELEKGFWICDYISATRGIEGPRAVTCGANFEELKQKKFVGDFDALVEWWRVNKAAEYAALETTIAATF